MSIFQMYSDSKHCAVTRWFGKHIKFQGKYIPIALAAGLFPVAAIALTHYVDPTHIPSGKCTAPLGYSADNPQATIFPVLKKIQPGDTVLFKGGKHYYDSPIVIEVSGTPEKRICFTSYPGETAVFDFSKCSGDEPGILAKGSYGEYVKQVYENKSGDKGKGFELESSNNIFRECIFRNNGNSGLQIDGGASNNQIINCDAYDNGKSNPSDGDGFCPKLEVGTGNKFVGCRAWCNGDDGWDGYLKSNKEITTTLENCWAFRNGYYTNGSKTGGDGNGFKMGSKDGNHNHVLKNCLAFENLNKGFDQNHNQGTIELINCTAFNNVRFNYTMYDKVSSGHKHTIKNCISIKTTNTTATSVPDSLGSHVELGKNSWNSGVKVDPSDFKSTDFKGADGPRKSDGSLPDLDFMRLKEGSDLIDAGEDVSLPFKGKSPDLGCYESPYTATAVSQSIHSAKEALWNVTTLSGQLQFSFPHRINGSVSITIFEMSGKQVTSTTQHSTRADEIITISGLKNTGSYICTVKQGGIISTRKITVL